VSDPGTDRLALAAVEPVEPGMLVGLGTGRAAVRAIRALADRVQQGGLAIECVATSEASAVLARSLNLTVLEMSEVAALDYLFDGADEMDGRLRMIKGRGGAMTRERIVARASARRAYLLQTGKLVTRLGDKMPLPIEVIPFARASVAATLRDFGMEGPVRVDDEGQQYLTDNGNLVLDVSMPQDRDGAEVAGFLDETPGIVDHGLFLDEADDAIIEDASGEITHRVRGGGSHG
jgi:ribose 5-phosphate isomerase A